MTGRRRQRNDPREVRARPGNRVSMTSPLDAVADWNQGALGRESAPPGTAEPHDIAVSPAGSRHDRNASNAQKRFHV